MATAAAGPTGTCGTCGVIVIEGERFCSGCGVTLPAPPTAAGAAADASAPAAASAAPSASAVPGPYAIPAAEPAGMPFVPRDLGREDRQKRMGAARKWLIGLSVLTLLTGLFVYATGKSQVDKDIAAAEAQTAGMDPVERDRLMKESVGMTFQEAIDHDRGQVTMLLVINLVLTAAYAGLAFWAGRNALMASVVALLLFLMVTVANAAIEPKTLLQGIIMKALVIGVLAKAISAASEERKLRAAA